MRKDCFCLYLEKELKGKLEKEAKEKGLTLNAYIRLIISQRNAQNKLFKVM